jgi:hypothetical protein
VGSKFIDLKGKVFGRLKIIEYMGKSKHFHSMWECECSCVALVEVSTSNLRNGTIKSCGCLHKDSRPMCNLKHGMHGTSEYNTWISMRDRCYNKNSKVFDYYGGRGIKVCDAWRGENGFENFYKYMGPKRGSLLTIERIDVNGDYSLHNCRWATKGEQSKNKRCNIIYLLDGVPFNRNEIAVKFSINNKSIVYYEKKGFSKQEIIEILKKRILCTN